MDYWSIATPMRHGLRLGLEQVEMLPFADQDIFTLDAEQGIVDTAEIDAVLEIAEQIEILQARMLADHAALDRRAGHEHARGGAMVSPLLAFSSTI